jgi:hypothetical protein
MNYNFVDETVEDEAVRDIMHLHWWVNENINKEGDHLFHQVSRYSEKSYVNYAFKVNSSIRTTNKSNGKRTLFYALMDNNKVLKCSFFNVNVNGLLSEDYVLHFLLFELFDKADTFVISKKDESIDIPCFPSGTVRLPKEFITISDNNGRVITEDGELIVYRSDEQEIPDGVKLVDILKPITVDDILEAFKEAKKTSEERIARKKEINSNSSKGSKRKER